MHRNNRNQDYYRLNKRQYDREEDQFQQNSIYNRNNHHPQHPNTVIRKQGNGQVRKHPKTDKFSAQYLRSLIQPLKKVQKQKKQDYKIEIVKNQSASLKQYIPRGGKIYQPHYEQQKKILDKQIQEYQSKAINTNCLKLQISRKVSSNKYSDDQDWGKVEQQRKIQQKQDISSLSFSVDIPPLQVKDQRKEEQAINTQMKILKKEIKEMNKFIQVKQFKEIKQEDMAKQQIKVELKVTEQNIKCELKMIEKKDQREKVQNNTKIMKQANNQDALHQSQYKKITVFEQLIDAIDLVQQKGINQINKDQSLQKKIKEQQQKQLQKIKENKELITKLEQSNKNAKIFLTFLAISNIQSFTIKEVELKQLDFSIRLDSNGRPKIKQSHNITTDQLAKYIKFTKTSHYFPKIGQFQQQAQHYVDVAENIQFVQDQTNRIEFQLCQIKISNVQPIIQNYNDKSLIVVTNVSLLCMICGSKNQIVVWQNDMTVACSCKGNDCSEKIYGKISKARMEIVDQ